MSFDAVSKALEQVSRSNLILERYKKEIKDDVKVLGISLLAGYVFYGICLTLSALAVQGVLATPGGLGWKFGIGGTAFLGLSVLCSIPSLLFVLDQVKSFIILKKIEKLLTISQSSVAKTLSCYERSELLSLPTEITLHIFSFLKPAELMRVSEVCVRWYQLAQSESLWKSFFDQNVGEELKARLGSEPLLNLRWISALKYKKSRFVSLSRHIESSFFQTYDSSKLLKALKKLPEPKDPAGNG